MQFVSDFILCLQQSNKQILVKIYVTVVVLVVATLT